MFWVIILLLVLLAFFIDLSIRWFHIAMDEREENHRLRRLIERSYTDG